MVRERVANEDATTGLRTHSKDVKCVWQFQLNLTRRCLWEADAVAVQWVAAAWAVEWAVACSPRRSPNPVHTRYWSNQKGAQMRPFWFSELRKN